MVRMDQDSGLERICSGDITAVSSPAKAGEPVLRSARGYWIPRFRGE
jgi:hypothetical protein